MTRKNIEYRFTNKKIRPQIVLNRKLTLSGEISHDREILILKAFCTRI